MGWIRLHASISDYPMTVIRLTQTQPEHIILDDSTVCGDDCVGANTRVVPSERNVLAAVSLEICRECLSQWIEQVEDVDREETTRCGVHRTDARSPFVCARVVASSEARRISHPAAEGDIPACQRCYTWIRKMPENSVETDFDEATVWADRVDGM